MNFDQFGRASVIPGLAYAVELLQASLDDLRNTLNGLNEKPIKGTSSKKMKEYWSNMTPEERSIEMKRRLKLGIARKRRKSA